MEDLIWIEHGDGQHQKSVDELVAKCQAVNGRKN